MSKEEAGCMHNAIPFYNGVVDIQNVSCRVIDEVKEAYEPNVVVCQCGADGLSEDPMASFNLTLQGINQCVQHLINWNLPLMLVGGGKCFILQKSSTNQREITFS